MSGSRVACSFPNFEKEIEKWSVNLRIGTIIGQCLEINLKTEEFLEIWFTKFYEISDTVHFLAINEVWTKNFFFMIKTIMVITFFYENIF